MARFHAERGRRKHRGPERDAAALGDPRHRGPARHQVRLRRRALRRLHRARRRPRRTQLHAERRRRRGRRGRHHRGAPTRRATIRSRVAWRELSVPQCGFCQAGQIMQSRRAARRHAQPDATQEILDGMREQHLPLRLLRAHRRRRPPRLHGDLSHAEHPRPDRRAAGRQRIRIVPLGRHACLDGPFLRGAASRSPPSRRRPAPSRPTGPAARTCRTASSPTRWSSSPSTRTGR